jgi:hypothetical protein
VIAATWPANSPDSSPIENVWAWMQRWIDKQPPVDTFADFKQQVHEAWASIPCTMLSNLIGSMPTRLQLCIEREGKHTGY